MLAFLQLDDYHEPTVVKKINTDEEEEHEKEEEKKLKKKTRYTSFMEEV
jgi:hypothetical protein